MSGGNGNSFPAVMLSDSDQCQLLQSKVTDFGIRGSEDITSTSTYIEKVCDSGVVYCGKDRYSKF